MNKIAIILPAYNEELTISKTIEEFYKELPDAYIVIVDNNSSDKTAAIASSAIKILGAKGEVINEYRQGKGNAIRRAFTNVDADIYVMSDADLTYPANRVHDLIREVTENRVDMVVGDRLSGGHYENENKRGFHLLGNNLVRWLINTLFSSNLKDIMSGYRVFNRKFVKNYPILVSGFQLEVDLTLHALDKRFLIKEIPIEYKDRPAGSFSKLNTFVDGAKVIFTIMSVLRYYRPMVFFGWLSLFFGILGVVSALPVFNDWLLYHYIHHLPLAVLSVAFELVAVFSLGVGLILDSVVHHYKMDYERNLLS